MYRPKCASPLCDNTLNPRETLTSLHSRFNMCDHCIRTVVTKAVPRGGYIPSPAIRKIADMVLKRAAPTATDNAEAIRYARGSEWPRGNWEDRPAYRMAVLKYRKRKQRMNHLILGKRYAPSAEAIAKAVVHYVLVMTVMDLGHRYAVFCAGATFFGRRGMCPPKGRKHEVALGDSRYSKWKLSFSDFSMLGGHALKAAKRMEINVRDPDLKAFITVAYLKGVQEGIYDPPVAVPHHSMQTDMLGDTVFDHKLKPRSPEVPRRYRNKIRRSNGKVDGVWPTGIERVPLVSKPQPSPPPKKHISKPNTSWLWRKEETGS